MYDASKQTTGLELRRRLETEVLVCDGAMGTMLLGAGVSSERCLPELCLSRPDLVRAIHRAYVSAGAQIVTTNTFMANRLMMRRYGLDADVRRLNLAGAELALEVCRERGSKVLVAGSVGPATAPGRMSDPGEVEVWAAIGEQVAALDEAGVDLLIFETFGDLGALVSAVRTATETSSLPVIAQVTFLEDGRTIAGDTPEAVAEALSALEVAALGANCTLGPSGLRAVAERLARATMTPLSIQPNAGPPTLVNGRFQYQQNEEYFARAAQRFVELGASIVGGCCGTTPRHTAAIAAAVAGLRPGPRRGAIAAKTNAGELVGSVARGSDQFREKLLGGEFVVACELRLPEGSDPDAALAEVDLVSQAGADAIVIAPTSSARAHISPVSFGLLVRERLGMDAIFTAATSDKSLLGLQADLLGAHAFGLQTVLCESGTPAPTGQYPNVGGLFEVSPLELIEMLHSLNEARDHTGARIRRATTFLIGARVNPSAEDPEQQVALARREIAAGAHFLLTAPVFDLSDLQRFRTVLGEPRVPLLLGITVLKDYDHAEYLRYEVPGVRIPESVLDRLREDGGAEVGRQLATELVWAASGLVQGVVLTPPSGGAAEAAELLGAVLGIANGWQGPARLPLPRPPSPAPGDPA
jgi:homocysteine S-methyltransferase